MIAALDAHSLWLEGQVEPIAAKLAAATHIAALFDAMERHGIETLYVHASALEPLGLPATPPRSRAGHPFVHGAGISQRTLAPSIESDACEILIGAYQESGDVFAGAEDGRQLRDAAIAFREALDGWSFRQNAIATGSKLMHTLRRGVLTELGEHPDELADEQVEVPFGSWANPERLYPRERVMAWDVNGQRLAACSRLSLGIGGLEKREGDEFDKRLPGYHLVSAVADPFPGQIPPPLDVGWHTTPRIAMLEWLKVPVQIERSYVWTEHTPYLNPWYERMRDARQVLLYLTEHPEHDLAAPAALALGALKQTYLQPLGRLRSHRARGTLNYRPSWYDHIIGAELAREYLRLYQLAAAGVPVLAVYFDAIAIETEDTDPVLGAPAALEVSTQLGKFKHIGTMPTSEARAALYGDRTNVSGLFRALKASGSSGGLPVVREASEREEAAAPETPPTGVAAAYRPAHGGYCVR